MKDYKIVRGSWYQEELLTSPIPVLDGGYFSNSVFWGKEGILSRVPERLLLAYLFTMELELEASVSIVLILNVKGMHYIKQRYRTSILSNSFGVLLV